MSPQCSKRKKEYMKRYHSSKRGKEVAAKYLSSDKGIRAMDRHRHSEKYKQKMRDYKIKYRATPAYERVQKKYKLSAKGKKTTASYYRRRLLNNNGGIAFANSHLKHNYGLTIRQYDMILESQGGHCACCPEKNNHGRRLCVDHDHETGLVRGLLCNSCNIALGHVRDNAYRLMSLLEYVLEK